MNAKTFHLTARGASHIKKGKECQDASSSYQDDDCIIAVVCDGHGGDDYFRSAIGSRIGCEVAEQNIRNFFEGVETEKFLKDPDKNLKNLEASIINAWNEAVYSYHDEHPFSDEELKDVSEKNRKKYVYEGRIEGAYGTTLIAVAMNKNFWFGIHIGDGKCVAVNPEGVFKQPIPWDPKCFLNSTTSICDSDAIDRFRHFYSEKLPAAVFIGSDGIDDCFKNNEQLHNLYRTVIYSFATTDFDEACNGLEDYLPRLSAKGSGDDVSVAAILDLDIIPDLDIVKNYDMEKEKARIEENARIQAEKDAEEKRRVEEEHARFQRENNAKSKKTSPPSLTRFCEKCGERIRPGAKFCSNCGFDITGQQTEINQSATIDSIPELELEANSKETELKHDIQVDTNIQVDETASENSIGQDDISYKGTSDVSELEEAVVTEYPEKQLEEEVMTEVETKDLPNDDSPLSESEVLDEQVVENSEEISPDDTIIEEDIEIEVEVNELSEDRAEEDVEEQEKDI